MLLTHLNVPTGPVETPTFIFAENDSCAFNSHHVCSFIFVCKSGFMLDKDMSGHRLWAGISWNTSVFHCIPLICPNPQTSKNQIKVDLVDENFTELRGEIAGPPDTPYEGIVTVQHHNDLTRYLHQDFSMLWFALLKHFVVFLYIQGGRYQLEIKIPETYPFNPPKVCASVVPIWCCMSFTSLTQVYLHAHYHLVSIMVLEWTYSEIKNFASSKPVWGIWRCQLKHSNVAS